MWDTDWELHRNFLTKDDADWPPMHTGFSQDLSVTNVVIYLPSGH